MAAGLAWQLSVAAVPVVLGRAIDRGVVAREVPTLWWCAAALVLLGALTAAADALRHRCEILAGTGTQVQLRERLAAVVLGADAAGRDDWPPSEVVARATGDVDAVAEAAESLSWLVAQAVVIPVVVVALVVIDPLLAVAAVAAVLLAVLAAWRASAAWDGRTARSQEAMAGYVADTYGVLEGYKVIRGAGAEVGVRRGIEQRSAEVRDRTIHAARLWVVFGPVVEILSGLVAVLLLWVGGERVIGGSLGLGQVVAAIGLAIVLVEPMGSVGYGLVALRQALVSTRRLGEVVDGLPVRDGGGHVPVVGGPVVLEARKLVFAHAGSAGAPILDGVDFRAHAGQVVLLDGPVGSGKSTLLALIAGDRAPTRGGIDLHGEPLDSWAADERRRAVLRLGPAPFLLADTIAANLRLGAPDAGDGELLDALDLAQATEVVADLPDGLDTVLADRGASLSGGQRQRIALARAVLARPDVLLLDAATSGLEPTRELAVLVGLRRRWADGILVVISANPAVRDLADVVVDLPAPAWRLDEAAS